MMQNGSQGRTWWLMGGIVHGSSIPNKKNALLTNDVETTSIWYNSLRDETGKKVLEEGMPALLDIYAKYNVRSTFFFTAYIAKLYPEIVKMIIKDGHEVASHGKSHLKENGFDIMPLTKQKDHLEYSKKLLEDISGQEVVSFRAPALRVNNDTVRALIETGFKFDSSVASQRFDFFMSFGGIKKLKWLYSPRLPYRVAENNIFMKGQSSLIEIPLTALVTPYVGTTMRLMPKYTALQRWILHQESKLTGKPMVFDIHPNELIDESGDARNIERRSSNPIQYLLQDIVRSKLKVKNLGKRAIPLYEDMILFYAEREYEFRTIRDYGESLKV
nr:peptidoglycan-N-acetylglucosamine deacetylase [Candidatus Cloacimonadota bacterium]